MKRRRRYPVPKIFVRSRVEDLQKEIDVLIEIIGPHDTYGSDAPDFLRCPCSSCKRFLSAVKERDALSYDP